MKRYFFVINPASGGTDKGDLVREIKYWCTLKSIDYRIHETTGENDRQEAEKIIGDFDPDRVVIAGGDGTINQFALVILHHGKTLGIIPTGSANGLARELGITMENALEIAFEGEEKTLDVTMLNDLPMLHMADFGLNATLVKRYQEDNRSGFLGYALSAINELPFPESPFKVTVHSSEKQQAFETKFLVIANARTYGTGYSVNNIGKLNDQKIELCALRELSPKLIIDHLFRDQENGQGNNELFDVLSASKATLRCSEPINLQIDGEYIGQKDELSIEVLTDQLKVLAGHVIIGSL